MNRISQKLWQSPIYWAVEPANYINQQGGWTPLRWISPSPNMCEIPKRNPGENVLWNLLWNVLAPFIFGAHTFGWIYDIWGMDYLFGGSVLTGDLLSLAPLFWDRAMQKKIQTVGYSSMVLPKWVSNEPQSWSKYSSNYLDILETIRHPSIPCWHLISVMAIATCLQPILSIPQRYSRSSQFHHQKTWFLLYSHSHPPHDGSQRSCRLKPTCTPLTWRRRNSARWSYAKMGRQSTRPPLRRPSWEKKPNGNHGR